MDFYCLAGTGGLRAGYLSTRRLAALPRGLRRAERNRAVLLLTANRAYALGGVRPGDSLSSARRHLRLRLAYTIGRNRWYLTAGAGCEACSRSSPGTRWRSGSPTAG